MITGNNGSRLESWLHAWSMGITRKSKRRTVSHADTSLISLPNDSSSIRHRFLLRKNLENQLLRQRVQKCMIATVTEAHLTAFVSRKKIISLLGPLLRPVLSRVITYQLIIAWWLFTCFIVRKTFLWDILCVSIILRCNIKFDYKIYVRASISR